MPTHPERRISVRKQQPTSTSTEAPLRLVTGIEAGRMLGLSPKTLANMRHRGSGPRFYRLSGRAVRYHLGDVIAWAERHRRTSTSDQGAGE
jgi:predicted DNA-binding transcriptional regulator AlpA